MPNPAKAHDRQQADRLARGFAAEVRRQQAETAALVQALAGSHVPEVAGAHDRRTLAELVRDSGFSSADDEAAVLSIDGRGYR